MYRSRYFDTYYLYSNSSRSLYSVESSLTLILIGIALMLYIYIVIVYITNVEMQKLVSAQASRTIQTRNSNCVHILIFIYANIDMIDDYDMKVRSPTCICILPLMLDFDAAK